MPTPEAIRLTDEPRCPRCGYDQRGAVAAWTDVCPMEGICSECGYRFAWSDVMRPDRWLLRGFFEHARGVLRSWVSAMRTLCWALLPWVFWSKVKLHHEVNVRRLLTWPIVAFGTAWMVLVVVRMGGYFTFGPFAGRTPGVPFGGLLQELVNTVAFPVVYWWGSWFEILVDEWGPVLLGLFAAGIGWPVLLLILPETRRRAKVRWQHLLRAGVYGLAWVSVHIALLVVMAVQGLLLGDWDVSLGMSGSVVDLLYEWWPLYGLTLTAWMSAWWWFAMARGFQIERATLHWAVLMVPVLLLELVVFVTNM